MKSMKHFVLVEREISFKTLRVGNTVIDFLSAEDGVIVLGSIGCIEYEKPRKNTDQIVIQVYRRGDALAKMNGVL